MDERDLVAAKATQQRPRLAAAEEVPRVDEQAAPLPADGRAQLARVREAAQFAVRRELEREPYTGVGEDLRRGAQVQDRVRRRGVERGDAQRRAGRRRRVREPMGRLDDAALADGEDADVGAPKPARDKHRAEVVDAPVRGRRVVVEPGGGEPGGRDAVEHRLEGPRRRRLRDVFVAAGKPHPVGGECGEALGHALCASGTDRRERRTPEPSATPVTISTSPPSFGGVACSPRNRAPRASAKTGVTYVTSAERDAPCAETIQ